MASNASCPSVGEDMIHARNNFDFCRLGAALMVVVFHSYVLTGNGSQEPMVARSLIDLGTLGVAIFFVISGYLVTGSYLREPRFWPFIVKRLLRIIPGLAAVLVATVLIIGPLTTQLALRDYWTSPITWLYPLRNIALYPVTYDLPGVFIDNPHPNAVNGSLWSLRLEFTCYLAVVVLGIAGMLRRRELIVILIVAVSMLAGAVALSEHIPAQLLIFLRYLTLFMAGAFFSVSGICAMDWGRPSTRAAAVVMFIVVIGASAFGAWGSIIFSLLLAVPVLVFALNPLPGVASIGRFGDMSYGLYVWAFPIQQLVIDRMNNALTPSTLTVVTLILTMPVAALSWWFIERPALSLKRRAGEFLSRPAIAPGA